MQNVLLLERAVLDGSVGDVAELLKVLGPFEFTARALALSIRFGDAAKTELLLKSGASLDFDVSSNRMRLEYSTIYSTSEIWGSDYPAKYALFPVFDRITERQVFFGTLYEQSSGVSPNLLLPDGSEREAAPERVRAQSVDVACTHHAFGAERAEELLYYAVLFGCHGVSDVLLRHGVRLNPQRDISGGYVRLISSFADIRVATLGDLQGELAKSRSSFEVNDGMVTYLLRYESWLTTRWTELLTLLMCGKPSQQALKAVAMKLTQLDADAKLAQLSELGLLPIAALSELLELAIDDDCTRALAFLLNLKNDVQRLQK